MVLRHPLPCVRGTHRLRARHGHHLRTRRTLVALEDYMVDEQPEELTDDALDNLADALLALKEKARDLIVLHYYTGHTLKEVAEMMGMSYINAKVIHKKALESLRAFFAAR